MNNSVIDKVTKFLNAATNIIIIAHPVRTSLGVFAGVAIEAITKIFAPTFRYFSSTIDISVVTWWEYVILGVVLLHVPTIRFYLSRKGSFLSEEVERGFEIIDRAKSAGVPDWRIQQMYLELCEKVLERTELKQATKEEIQDYLAEE